MWEPATPRACQGRSADGGVRGCGAPGAGARARFQGVSFRTVRESELLQLPDVEQDHVLAPIQLLLELARRNALVPVLLLGLALGFVVVVGDEAARSGSVELVDDGLMLGVLEVSSQVVRGPETDEEPVGVVPASPAEVLADG